MNKVRLAQGRSLRYRGAAKHTTVYHITCYSSSRTTAEVGFAAIARGYTWMFVYLTHFIHRNHRPAEQHAQELQ